MDEAGYPYPHPHPWMFHIFFDIRIRVLSVDVLRISIFSIL